MPRGKKLTIEAKIEAKQLEITQLTEKLKQVKDELKNLEKEKEDEDLKRLYDAVKSSGKTLDEVIALLQVDENQ